jgi:ATP-dependent Clp protease protease subunit
MRKLMQLLRDNAPANRAELVVQNSDAETTLYLYGVIYADDAVNALAVANALNAAPKGSTVRMRLNGPGGDIFEARAIVTAMRDFRNSGGKIITQVDALAASAMSWVAVEGDEVLIADGAFMMVHNAMGLCFGSASDMREYAGTLEKIEGSIVNEFVQTSGRPADQVQAWIDAETWFDAQEAVANGLADRVVSQLLDKPSNLVVPKWNLTAFEKPPAKLIEPPAPAADEPDYEAIRAHNERRLSLIQFA